MPGTVSHVLSATTPDNTSYEIRPSHWNSGHLITINAVGSEISGAFDNAGGITFGLETNGSITAAAPPGAPSPINFSAGTTSGNIGSVVFADSNGISFGLNGSTITGTVKTAYVGLNTAKTNVTWTVNSDGISLNAGGYAGTSTGITGGSVTLDTSGIAINLPAYLTTARRSTDAVGLNTAQTNVTWTVNSSGISLNAGGYAGTSTGITGGSVTLDTSGIAISLPAYLTTARRSTDAVGLNTAQTSVTWTVNSSGISIDAGAYLTTARRSTDAIGLNTAQSNVTWTVNSSGLSLDARGYAGTGTSATNASITLNSNGLAISVAAPGAAAEQNAVNLLGANTAGNTTATGSTIGLSGLNLTLSGTNNSQIVLSVPATSSLVGVNGISVSTNGSTISVMPQWVSSYENMPAGLNGSSVMTWNGASVSHAVAFDLPAPISASFIRIPALMTTNSTTLATINSATASGQGALFSTLNAVIYSLGVGGNSQSLQSVASGSAGYTFSQKLSMSNTTQGSYSLGFSAQANGGGTTRTTQYSISNTNYSFTTNQIATEFSSVRFLDIPFANSLSPGVYWAVVGLSTSSSTAGAAGIANNITNCNVRYSAHYGVSQADLSFGIMGSTDRTSGGLMGAGSFSTAGGGTTASLPISAISSIASLAKIYFQILRSA